MCRQSIALVCVGLVLGLIHTDIAAAADAGLVGWWKFDETSGTVAVDSSVSGKNGTVWGAPRWTDGQVDGALYLDGNGTYVELPLASIVRSLTDGTFGLWVKPVGSISEGQRIIEFGNWYSNYLFLSINPLRLVIRASLANGAAEEVSAGGALDGDWHHLAVTIDSTNSAMAIYLDGDVAGSAAMVENKLSYLGGTAYNFIGRGEEETPTFRGYVDDLHLFSRVLSLDEIRTLMQRAELSRERASHPVPGDQEADVLRDTTFRWTAGVSVNTHNVYFGDSFEDIENADTSSPLLVHVSESVTSYDPGRLEFGRTYYWRVDGVSGAPDYTVFKGHVWSFTVESYTYPIPATCITAIASSHVEGRGPERTIDGSGLNANDMHSTVQTDMWQTAKAESLPAWIQYEFDRPYKLDSMRVWNYNGESFLAIVGAREVAVEHSLDGVDWTQLDNVSEFPMAIGAAHYASDTVVDFGGVAAKYVRITVQSNYAGGMSGQCGLSEVRLMTIPVAARNPHPEPDANNVDLRAVLTWDPGRQADAHQVHFSTDRNAVASGAALVDGVCAATYSVGGLNLGTTYYWKIDEVNDAETPSVWEGSIWNFTTTEYRVVDDFESYTDEAGEEVFATWADGYQDAGNGSQVGHYTAPYAEQNVYHSGDQSMPLYYGNGGASRSEATRTFDPAQDWTQGGANTLILYVHGRADNVAGQLYVKVNGMEKAVDVDFAAESWQEVSIELASLGVNLQSVSTLSIGIDGSGASGPLYIDDIRLK